MRRKKTPMGEKRKFKMSICFNHWEREFIEEAIHIQGLKGGGFTSFASFVRGNAIARAHALRLQWQKRSKLGRNQLQAEYERDYCEIEDHQETG